MKLRYLFVPLLITYAAAAQPANDTSAPVLTNKLGEVTITASAGRAQRMVEETQMGKVDLPMSMMKRVPAIAGEPDIIKALQLTPGVKRGTEGAIGMYVRGGGNDENLILLDGAPVYNAGHLLGFFSIFNTATLKDAQLYKSAFPAQYGGRLSSVLDVKTKEGSMTEFKGTAGIGLIASAFSVQGPILKDKLSFIVSGRRTYIDKVYTYIPYHFYDVNSKLTYAANSRNRFYLSMYKGDDVLKSPENNEEESDTSLQFKSGMRLNNQAATLRWNHLSGDNKYSSDLTFVYSNFNYNIHGRLGGNAVDIRSAIRDLGVKGEVRLHGNGKHKLSGGFSFFNHFFNPNIISSEGAILSELNKRKGKEIYNNEAGIYIADEYRIDDRWLANMGMHMSADFVPGKVYLNAEPRLALRYCINENSSLKMSYSKMVQYMHLVSSSSLALPTDLWYPVTSNIKPGSSHQVSAGYYYAIPSLDISLSGEVYYKWMNGLVEYKEGAVLILNNNYEKELVHGKGRSYGIELFASKTYGRFTGWIGYSLSYAHRTFDSLNNGQEYYAKYDRRHDLSVVSMYDFSKKWSMSSAIVYATGNPFTGQVNQYVLPKPDFSGFDIMPAYSGRNELRLSAAFRIDLDVQYKFRLGKRITCDAHASIYNLLNRAQPYTVRRVWDTKANSFKYQQDGLFGIIPTATLNLNF